MILKTQNNLPIEFTQGEQANLLLLAVDDSGNPVDLTGFNLTTQILGPNGIGPITFPNSQHTLADQVANRGGFTLALAPADTAACGEGPSKQIITEANNGGYYIDYFRGNNLLTVYPNVPIQ